MSYTIKESLKKLKISKSKLYGLLAQLRIRTEKKSGKSYLSAEQIEQIQAYMDDSTQSAHLGWQADTFLLLENLKQQHEAEIERLKAVYEQQQTTLQTQLDMERENNQQLSITLWQWQGRSKTLEEQNQKLLTEQSTATQKKKGWLSKLFGK